MIRTIAKPVSLVLMLSFLFMGFSLGRAQAAMVGTEAVLNTKAEQSARNRLYQFLDRQKVQAILKAQGISPQEAKARIACMSDSEVAHMAKVVNQLPAGGDGVGALIGAALLVFIVLLITDILGFTHIFPWVNHGRA